MGSVISFFPSPSTWIGQHQRRPAWRAARLQEPRPALDPAQQVGRRGTLSRPRSRLRKCLPRRTAEAIIQDRQEGSVPLLDRPFALLETLSSRSFPLRLATVITLVRDCQDLSA